MLDLVRQATQCIMRQLEHLRQIRAYQVATFLQAVCVACRASSGGREVQGRAFRACEVRKMADLDRTGGMMVVLFIALAAIKFFG